MYSTKKGQAPDGRFVSYIILLLALSMILYLLFIPPSEREQILNQQTESNSYGNSSSTSSLASHEEILVTAPGLVTPDKAFGTEHQLPPINLFLKTEPSIVNLAQTLSVKNGMFDDVTPTLSFDLDNADIKKVLVSFSVKDPAGELRLSVNGNAFFSQELTPGIQVIELPLSFIKEKNKLDFSVSSPGLAFWSTNSYTLQNVAIKVEYERINTQETRTFTITQTEKTTVNGASLNYGQYCNTPLTRGSTPIRIFVNDNNIFTGTLTCTSTRQHYEFDPNFLVVGQNNVRFLLDNGDFFFNEVKLTTTSSQAQFPTYTFMLNNDQANVLQAGRKKGTVDFVFGVANQQKVGKLQVNGKEFSLRTDQNAVSIDVSSALTEGTNTIRFIPSSSFEIVKLSVVLA